MDKIVVLKDGQVSEVGSFSELMSRAGAFAEFLKIYLTQELVEGESAVDAAAFEGKFNKISELQM